MIPVALIKHFLGNKFFAAASSKLRSAPCFFRRLIARLNCVDCLILSTIYPRQSLRGSPISEKLFGCIEHLPAAVFEFIHCCPQGGTRALGYGRKGQSADIHGLLNKHADCIGRTDPYRLEDFVCPL